MSAYGTKVVAVLDTQSTFGVTIKQLKENVDTLSGQMSTLLADAPETLDTLNEIAAALADDPAFFSTIANQVSELNTDITDLVTALGIAENDSNIGTFTSPTLPDDTTLRDVLEAFASSYDTTKSNLETADSNLSGRLDVLEADPTTQTLLDAEADARDNADDALDVRIDAEETAREGADSALDARLDVLEADPTTAAAVAAVQADVDANETERKTYFDWDSNLSKVINPLRGSRIDVGNNITFYPAAGYNTEIKGNLITDNNTKVFFTLTDAADDTAAEAAGVDVGQLYRNGSVVMIRVS